MKKIDTISQALGTETAFNTRDGKIFNVNTINEENNQAINEEKQEIQNVDSKSTEQQEDEDTVKRNLRTLIEKSMDLADEMFEVVRVSDSPKAYEPASAYLKTVAELNEKLLDIYDRDNKNKPKTNNGSTVNTQNNNNTIICKDPSEILKMLGKK